MRRGSRTPDTRTRMWHKLGNAAGVRPIRLHDARHSCGTVLHLRGVPLAVIAKWLGHADASITARLYTYSQGEALRDAGNSLGGVDILVTLRPSGELIAPSPIHVSAGQRWFQRVPRQDSNLRPSAPETQSRPFARVRPTVEANMPGGPVPCSYSG
jgi:hypothetical protein